MICEKIGMNVAVIGDGGMEEGIVFETINLSSKKKLPVLYICENNNYSIFYQINPDKPYCPKFSQNCNNCYHVWCNTRKRY